MSEEKKIGYRDIFRQKEYMKLLVAGLINVFGDSIDAIAFTWLVYQLTGNAAWSALVFGINSLPTILVTPFAGVWVEGRNKKHIMIGTDIMRACCVLFVALSYATERLQPWMLVATTILISTVEAFRGPADTALTPKVLDREYLEYGLSLDGSFSRAVSIIGTALAGGIIALFGITGAIYIDIATFLASAGIIAFMRYQEEKVSPRAFSGKEYMRSLKDGVQYVRKSSTFMFFIAACVVLNALLTPFNSLQAPLVEEVLQSGATMLSVISVAATGGIMFGSISYPWVKNYLSARKLFGLCGFGICFYYILLVAGRPLYVYELPAYVYAADCVYGLFCIVADDIYECRVYKESERRIPCQGFGNPDCRQCGLYAGHVFSYQCNHRVYRYGGDLSGYRNHRRNYLRVYGQKPRAG